MPFSAPLRIALGFAPAAACAWLFVSLWRRSRAQPKPGCSGAAPGQPPLAVIDHLADRAQVETGRLAPAPPPAAGARPLRLLVVDDARVNREVVRALLRPDGHVIEEAASGSDAIAALRRGPLPDLVLMDVNMPGMDGFAATAAIRALDGPAARLPIIALTGEAMPDAVAAGRAAGMDGHLTKPLQRAVLLAELARLAPAP